MRFFLRVFPVVIAAGLCALVALAVPPEAQKKPKNPNLIEPAAAAKRATVEGGLVPTVWAAEPLFENPVAFAFDEQGKCYVCETFRHTDGVTDTRGHMYWLDDDIASRTVADRVAMYKKHNYSDYAKFGEQLRVVWDSTGSGTADQSEVFAGPYNRAQDGLAAGVLARKGSIYFACIPDLYLLKDTKGANKADVKQSLATGFGIHVQFIGHDLHGLRFGPDGKLYMSIGDRGLNITTKEGKHLFYPDTGCVLRCDADGANLEVVHSGLRNPQELAFDELGNLFTYDNNSDSGDQARWVQIVEGGDSGWRCGYQYGTLMHTPVVPQGNRGPWNTEQIWHVPSATSTPPAYVVPALKNFGNGPAGLTYYPGVGLNDRYRNHFFAADFTANPGNSRIWTLELKPKGASFEIDDLHEFVKNAVPTDCEFGPDGAFYWSDWTGGWDKPAAGRMFRVADPVAMKNPAVGEAQKYLREGFAQTPVPKLIELVSHAHREVRQEAQFELAKRLADKDALAQVKAAYTSAKDRLPKLHLMWALGQVGDLTLARLAIGDSDEVVRGQAAKLLGRSTDPADAPLLEKAISDTNDHVRAFAAISYGKVAMFNEEQPVKPGSEQAKFAPLFELLLKNNNQDAYLRHAAVQGLATLVAANPTELVNAWKVAGVKYDVPAVRLGVVLALRKLSSPLLATFVSDADTTVSVEAARAIHDLNIMPAMPDLANLARQPNLPEPLMFRALSANFKLGTPANADVLARFAARSSENDTLRITALKLLADWPNPPRRDPITGLTMSLEKRDPAIAANALKPVLSGIFAGSDAVRKESVAVVSKLGIKEVGSLLAGLAQDAKQPARTRVDSLLALESLKAKELSAVAAALKAETEPRMRGTLLAIATRNKPTDAVAALNTLLSPGAIPIAPTVQTMLDALAGQPESPEVDAFLAKQLEAILAGTYAPDLKRDVLDAAELRVKREKLKLHAPLKDLLAKFEKDQTTKGAKNIALGYEDTLFGGDAERGRNIFLNNSAVYCQRCHKLDGQGGEVGPIMNGISKDKQRPYLLESIVNPNAQIAQGYQSVILSTVDGKSISGVLRSKDAKAITIVTAENKTLVIPREDIEGERPDQSAMPADLYKKLTRREIRDLVEFLATVK